MILTLYHDYQEEQAYPTWLVALMDKNAWELETLYFSVLHGYEHKNMNEFPEDVLSFSVYQEDLVLSEKIGEVGINLQQVKKRISEQFPTVSEVTQLMIRVVDLEEVLTLSRRL